MKVINNAKSPIGLPGYGVIMQGETSPEIRDDHWERFKANRVIAGWLSRGMLVEAVELEPVRDEEPQSDEKDELISALAEIGINRDRRSSVDRLRSELEAATAPAAATDDAEQEG